MTSDLRAVDLRQPSEWPAAARAAGRVAGLVSAIAGILARQRLAASEADSGAAKAARTHEAATTILARHGVVVVTTGERPRGPAVVVTNHVSYLDPLVVASAAPCIAVAKGETRNWPLVGRGLAALGVVFVRRGDAYSGAIALRGCLRALRAGTSILNFPEGTTTDGGSVLPFHRGVFGLARLSGVPIVPASIAYDDPRVAWFGGRAFLPHYASLARTPRVVARVRFGEPIAPLAHERIEDLTLRGRAAVVGLLGL
jgi:1-acyl-sn-glycerol-3-phosphate acyltransferase